MRRGRARTAALAVAAVLLAVVAGCTDGESLMNPVSIGVSAGSGTTPAYAWSGEGVFSVTVARVASPDDTVWGVLTPGANGLASPVTHGTVPSGAVRTANSEPVLTAGVEYRVTVERLDGDASGSADFTP